MADHFTRRIWGASNVLYGEDYGHGTYYNALHLDGSARGLTCHHGYMRAMNTQSTNAPGNPVQETIWREFFEQ